MTPEEIHELSDAELDAMCAEGIGWMPPQHELQFGKWTTVPEHEDIGMGPIVAMKHEDGTRATLGEYNRSFRWCAPDGQYHCRPPCYATEHAAARELVDEVERRGAELKQAYSRQLLRVLGWDDDVYGESLGIAWDCAHATSRQRSEAFAACMEKDDG